MGEPATEMDLMDSAKASRGLDLGLKYAMASDLDGLRWRPCSEASCGPFGGKTLSRQPDVPVWMHKYRYTAACHQHIDERTPGLVVSDRSGFITLATGDMKSTKRSGPRTDPWGTPMDIVVEGEDDVSILLLLLLLLNRIMRRQLKQVASKGSSFNKR